MRRLDSITDSMDLNLSKLLETVKDRACWHPAVHEVTKSGHDLATKQQLCAKQGGPKLPVFMEFIFYLAKIDNNLEKNQVKQLFTLRS